MELQELLPTSVKILIADDVTSARVVLKGFLKALGYQNVLEAKNGEELLALIDQNPDTGLIICDWEMPEKLGIEVVQHLQQDERFKDIPFIMATSRSETEDVVQAAVSGVWGYITKPVTQLTLKQEIHDALLAQREASAT